MHAKTFAVVCSFFLFLALSASGAAFAGPLDSTVWVDVERPDGMVFNGHRLPQKGEGMGVVLSPYEVVTAAHVVWRAEVITISAVNGAKVSAKVVSIDSAIDAAVLRLEQPVGRTATVRLSAARTGEEVSTLGLMPRSFVDAPPVRSGIIGASKWTSNGVAVPTLFLQLKGEKGMSGGGVFDGKGELIGIVIRIDGTLGYLSALPVADLCARIARCESVR